MLLTLVVSAVVFIGAIWVNMSVKQRSTKRRRRMARVSGVGGAKGLTRLFSGGSGAGNMEDSPPIRVD